MGLSFLHTIILKNPLERCKCNVHNLERSCNTSSPFRIQEMLRAASLMDGLNNKAQ